MLPDLDTFVVLLYAVCISAALVAEFAPQRKLARRAGILSIVLALSGGVIWTYAVVQRGYIFSPAEKITASRNGGGGSITLFGGSAGGGGRSKYIDRSGGSEPNLEDGEAADEGSGSLGGSIITAALGDRGNGGGLDLGWMTGRSKIADTGVHETDGEVKQDCSDCPEMLIIAGGNTMIGAPDHDVQASSAEMPARFVRMWPGFAFSRNPINAAQFAAAKAALALPERSCQGPAPEPALHAVCITAGDAEAYAEWLTQRTGRRYRLPTAIEWEYAARTRGTVVVASIKPDVGAGAKSPAADEPIALPLAGIGQSLAEMTADCFDPYLPSQGKERHAWSADPRLCEERVLKGAGLGEDSRHARFSARRPWRNDQPRWTVGFRVVRDLQ